MRRLGTEEKSETQKQETDAFLVEYLSKQKWKDLSMNFKVTDGEEDDPDVDDEEELDAVDRFESKYNFRFEEINDETEGSQFSRDAYKIVGHSRQIEGSLRRVDDSRKVQREQRKERKDKERRKKEAELKRLKNLKRQEVF